MFDYVILILCAYVVYSNFTKLFEVPFAEWEFVQWLLLIVTIGIVVIAIIRGYYVVKKVLKKREQGEEAAEEGAQDARADATLDEKNGTDGPVVVTMEDLKHLDEIDLPDDDE